MTTQFPNIQKQDGSIEPFNPDKLQKSLERSGTDPSIAKPIVEHIKKEVREGDTTNVIYRHAFSILKQKKDTVPAARYSMKRAIQELGPSGFPFEDFVAEIFKARGYKTKTGAMEEGKCAVHEIDLIAEKDGKKIGAELKFHNSLSLNSDLKVALYVDARFVDLIPEKVDEGWLITNTRFTRNAIEYGECRRLKMVSWSYPKGECLQDLIEKSGVQPVTALTTLLKHEKKKLLDKGVVLCHMLNTNPRSLDDVIPEKKRVKVLSESNSLCGRAKEV